MRNELNIVQLALLVEILLLHSVEILAALALSRTGQILFVHFNLRFQRCALGRLLAQVLTADRLITFGFDRMGGRRFDRLLLVGFGEGRRIVG